ncbi:MAG: ParM/StbA family protein [Lachnospiraceae bacterium]|nr:ParM/StbA family protein [Lachnospiraceae bacterium]
MRIIGGIDIGNGYVKGLIENEKTHKETVVDIPSSVAYVTNIHDIKTEGKDIPYVIDNIFNEADISFDTPLIKDQNRRLFGERGVLSGMSLEEFDIYSHISKANQDLSGVLLLGSIACKALQDYYDEKKMLPVDIITVKARIAIALPIREYIRHRVDYANRLKSDTHMVTFYNFERLIRFNIVLQDVQVLAEGASAQFAIIQKANELGEGFLTALLDDVRKVDPSFDPAITAEDIKAATSVAGIDIGEGTVNFPVFMGGKFNSDASFTLDKGYGSVMAKALDRLTDDGHAFKTRKDLETFLLKKPSAMQRTMHETVSHVVEEETVAFVKEITAQFKKLIVRIGSMLEVVYVYGGGATAIKDALHPALVKVKHESNAGYPIMYLDSRYSRKLNREGLMYIAKRY